MKKITKIFFTFSVILLFSSCNPQMHIVGAGMRHHNLSQNKYQPKKQRKQVNLGTSPNSPFWFFLRRR